MAVLTKQQLEKMAAVQASVGQKAFQDRVHSAQFVEAVSVVEAQQSVVRQEQQHQASMAAQRHEYHSRATDEHGNECVAQLVFTLMVLKPADKTVAVAAWEMNARFTGVMGTQAFKFFAFVGMQMEANKGQPGLVQQFTNAVKGLLAGMFKLFPGTVNAQRLEEEEVRAGHRIAPGQSD